MRNGTPLSTAADDAGTSVALMDLAARATLVAAAHALAATGWALLRSRRGVVRSARAGASNLPDAWAVADARDGTLVQLSSQVCSACAASARTWRAALGSSPGVSFLEIDAAEHLDLVREAGVLTTPTTLIYDAHRRLRGRVVGAPTRQQAAEALRLPTAGSLG